MTRTNATAEHSSIGCRDGLVTVPSEDGPVDYACTGECCKQDSEVVGPGVRARIARTGDVFLGAAARADADEEW